MKKLIFLGLAVSLMVMCTLITTGHAEEDVIKIGTIFSRTGPLANLGLESWRGMPVQVRESVLQ